MIPALFPARVRAIGAMLFLGLGLWGCATVADPRGAAFLAPDLPYRTPPPRALGRDIAVVQMITARYRGESFVFEAYLSVAAETLTLIATDLLGRRALTLTMRGTDISAEIAPWVPGFIRPENILADITIMYWPDAAVRAGLAGTGAILRVEPRQRVIAADGRDIIRVNYEGVPVAGWPALGRYRNLAFGYELDVRSAVGE